MEFHDRLAALRAAQGETLAAGSEAETRALDAFRRFFADFSPAKIEVLLDQTYAADVWFNDTLKTIRGRQDLRHYLAESAAAVESCQVTVDEVTRTAQGEYLLRWTMTIRFKRFKRGQDTTTIGISLLRFDSEGKVLMHQDFWDATQGIFEHVPVLGWMIGKIKRRL